MFSTDEKTRQQAERSYNLFAHSRKYAFISFPLYFAGLARNYPEHQTYFKNFRNNFILMEKEQLEKLSSKFSAMFESETIINYFFFRLLAAHEHVVLKLATQEILSVKADPAPFGGFKVLHNRKGANVDVEQLLNAREQCAYETMELLQHTNARFYVNALYPTEQARKDLQKFVFKNF